VFPAKTSATNSNPAVSLVSSGTTTNYTGDGTSGLYVWGLQINLGTSALPYRSTTTAALWLPRFENDPITGDARGLLIEGGTTNVVTGSSGGTGLTITTAAITSPTGVVDGIRALKSDTTTPRYFRWVTTVTPTVNTTYTASMFVKRGNVDMTTSLEYNASGDWGGTGWIANFSVTATGVTVSSTSAATATVQDVGNGWYRVTATFTTGATTPTANGLILCKVSGTTNDFIYFWGGQLEAQAFASSYIPTTTATVARGADVALMTGTNFSSWYNQAEGTIFAISQGLPQGAPTGVLYQVDDGTNAERQLAFPASGGSSVQVTARTHDNNVINNSFAFSSVNSLLPIRVAYAYASGNYGGSCNGSNTQTAASSGVPTVNKLSVGLIASGTNSTWINTTISRIAYWPTRLPDATLQALTT
jgi:hypothetical protein